MIVASSFFNSGTWLAIRNLSLLCVFIFWVATVVWIWKDAKRRIEDPWLIGVAVLVGFAPFIGVFIYMLLRPPEYLDDVRERELEIKAMEDRLSKRDLHCPVCRSEVDASFLVCPICTTKLKQACVNCKQPLEALWQVCPYCETPVEPAAVAMPTLEPPRRRRGARWPIAASMRSWFASHRERVAYGLAAALLVVSIGATSAGAVLLRKSANNQRQETRLQQLDHAVARHAHVAAALADVAAHDAAAGRRLRAVPPGRLESAVNAELQRLSDQASDRVPYARWTLLSAAFAFVLLVAVLVWLFELQRRAGRIDRDNARLRDEFVAVVSHELRTPLTSILGFVELIGDEEHRALDEEQRSYLEVVRRNAERLLHLVSDLLLVAEADDGTLRLDRADVDLGALAQQCVEAGQAAAARKDVELVAFAAPLRLHGDPLRLAQLLDNLISNAIKFTPEGGRVVVRVARADDEAVVEVEDSGVGISPADRQRIFERFYRARGAARDAVSGAGLGLAITQAIVEAHHGAIEVQSQVGVGTTFRVHLPLDAATNSSRLPQGSAA